MGETPWRFKSSHPHSQNRRQAGTPIIHIESAPDWIDWVTLGGAIAAAVAAGVALWTVLLNRRSLRAAILPQLVFVQLVGDNEHRILAIRNAGGGLAVGLRDQKALSETKLSRCLDDMTVPEWLRLLNEHVFFWLSESAMVNLLNGGEYRNREHDVIRFDTRALLGRHFNQAYLSPINSGATLFNAAKRGSNTFRPLALYDIFERRPPAELTVHDRVPDVQELVVSVERRQGTGSPHRLWTRSET